MPRLTCTGKCYERPRGRRSRPRCCKRAAALKVKGALAFVSPVPLLEAMAAGLPCAAAGTGGVPELVRDGEHGLLVAVSDSAGLAEAIERLMDDPALRAGLAGAGRARILADYVLKVNSARLGALFEERLVPGG